MRIEQHHIAGRNNSEITIPLCVGCHLHISERQMAWDSRWKLTNNTDGLRTSFIVQGVQEILREKGYKMGIIGYIRLADSLSSLVIGYREMS